MIEFCTISIKWPATNDWPGIYLGFFKWAGTPKLKWAGTAPPQSGQALQKWAGTKKKPAAGADFFTKKWAGSGGAQKSGQAVGGHPKFQSGQALFKKVQKWGGTRQSACPLPAHKYTPAPQKKTTQF